MNNIVDSEVFNNPCSQTVVAVYLYTFYCTEDAEIL